MTLGFRTFSHPAKRLWAKVACGLLVSMAIPAIGSCTGSWPGAVPPHPGGTGQSDPGPGSGDGQAEPGEKDQYAIYWVVTQKHEGWGPERETDLGDLPVRRNALILYQYMLSRFPLQGPHVLLTDPEFMDRHLRQVRERVQKRVPEGFDGPVLIDYETWYLLPEHTKNRSSEAGLDAHDHDFLDDMREAIALHRPQYFADAETAAERDAIVTRVYKGLARHFYVETIRLCKRLRPEAKWGFYGYPPKVYNSPKTADNHKGYGDPAWEVSRLNDEYFEWLLDEVDALYPSIYAQRKSVLPEQRTDWSLYNAPEQDRQYVLNNVREAVRLARGRVPVYPVASMNYQWGNPEEERANQFLNAVNMRHQLVLPRQAGADGVVIWGSLPADGDASRLQAYIDSTLGDAIRAAAKQGTESQPAPAD